MTRSRNSMALAVGLAAFAATAGAEHVNRVDFKEMDDRTSPLIKSDFTPTAAASPGTSAGQTALRKTDFGAAGLGLGMHASDGVSGDEAKIGGGTGGGTDINAAGTLQVKAGDDSGAGGPAAATLGAKTAADSIDSR